MSHAVRNPAPPGLGLLAGEAGRSQLAALVEATQEPIWSRTIDGVILSWNAAAEELFGYRANEVIGRAVDPTVPPERENEVRERIARLVEAESTVERLETIRRTRDGRNLDVHLSISPITDDRGRVAALSLVARDVTARKRAEAHLDRIHELTVALSRALTADAVIETVAAELRRVAGVERAWIGLVRDGFVESLHEEGLGTEPIDPIDAGSARPVAAVARTGEALWFESWHEMLQRFPSVADTRPTWGHGAWAMLPLIVDETVIGVASLGFDGDGSFEEAEKSYFLSVARQCAQALDRARLFEAERAARAAAEGAAARQARLREIGDLIARAETPSDVVRIVMSRGVHDFGADRGAVLLLEDDALGVEGATGYPEDLAERFGRLPIEADSPATEAMRRGEPIFLEDPRALAEAYPLALETGILVSAAAAYVPISVGDRPIGAIAIGFDSPHRFGPEDREYLEILGGQYAQAIERTRLRAAERSSAVRADLLARVSSLLSGSLDTARAVDQIVHLCVPTVADLCFGAILDERGGVGQLAMAGAAGFAMADGLLAPARLAIGTLATGLEVRSQVAPRWPRLVRDLTDADGSPLDDAQREAFQALGASSALLVPLVAHGDPLGFLVFLGTDPDRRFGRVDLALADNVAQRIATAIENARLYENLRHLARAERAQAAELAAVIQAIGEPVVVFDPAGRVRLANQAALELFRGGRFERLADLAARFEPSDRVPRIADGATGPVQLRLRGTDRWFELTAYPVQPRESRLNSAAAERGEGDDAVSMILLGRDVTALRQANRLRDAFIGMLSHELRTPITTIFGGTRILRREGLPEGVRREVFDDVTEEAERLHRLVEDLLVLARAERGEIEIGGEPVLLQHLLPPVVASEVAHWPSTRIELNVPQGMPPVSADLTYVEQVVRNLLSNAVKYSPPGSLIELRAEVLESEVQVSILDEGPGFQEDEAALLFELFFRLPATAATSKGAGIGLFVCRALIEAMGGRIWARPRPAGGAEFRFALPVVSDDGL